LTGVIGVVLLGLAAGVPAAAAPDGAAQDTRSTVTSTPAGAEPRPADIAASALMRWLDQHPQAAVGGVSVNDAGTSVTVYWKGAVPAAFDAVAAAQPTPVTFKAAKFSLAQLDREASRMADANQDLVASVGPLPDYSGTGVTMSSAAVAKGKTRADLKTGLTADIPVTITGTANPVRASRTGDTAPFWGSSLIYSTSSGYYCSSGASVYSGTVSYITTAAHCKAGPWYAPDSGYKVGDVVKSSAGRDTELIGGKSYDAVIYNGPWNSSTGVAVYDSERPADGTRICVDGAITGEHCTSVNVRGINQYVPVSGAGTIGPGFWILDTQVINGVQVGVAQPGDSGSATYAYTSASQASVRGFLVAVDLNFRTAQCGGNPNFSHFDCSSRAFAVNSVDSLSALGVRIKTTS